MNRNIFFYYSLVTVTILTLLHVESEAKSIQKLIPKWSTIYIGKIDEGLDQHLMAAIFKKNLPVKLVMTADQADFIIQGVFQGVLGTCAESSKNSGSAAVSLVDIDGTIIWAGSASETSSYSTGLIGVAREIAKQLQQVVQQ